jgi:ATPase subunit of ABC transporter with duplicated ATPase domains
LEATKDELAWTDTYSKMPSQSQQKQRKHKTKQNQNNKTNRTKKPAKRESDRLARSATSYREEMITLYQLNIGYGEETEGKQDFFFLWCGR